MKTRSAIGRTIVKIEQERFYDAEFGWQNNIRAIILDNGLRLVPIAYETSHEPTVDILVIRDK